MIWKSKSTPTLSLARLKKQEENTWSEPIVSRMSCSRKDSGGQSPFRSSLLGFGKTDAVKGTQMLTKIVKNLFNLVKKDSTLKTTDKVEWEKGFHHQRGAAESDGHKRCWNFPSLGWTCAQHRRRNCNSYRQKRNPTKLDKVKSRLDQGRIRLLTLLTCNLKVERRKEDTVHAERGWKKTKLQVKRWNNWELKGEILLCLLLIT